MAEARQVNIHEAKTHLSRLIQRAEEGEETVIARAGKPVARLVPLARRPRRRKLGGLEGRIVIHPSFYDDLPEDLIDAFYRPEL